jgi:uncharacterized protein YcfJ
MNLPLKSTALAASAFALLGAAGAARAAEYANVISATPVTSSVPVARQECADGQRVVPSQPSGGGALVGAIIGGVIGNQFGHGAGRVAATTLGAVTGGAIGNQAEMNNSPGQVVPVRDCRAVSSYQSRVVGYDVVYEYHGQRYTTRTATDPGPRLAIDVRPSGGQAYDDGAARGGYGAVPPAYDEPSYPQPPSAGYPVPPATYYSPAPAPVYAPGYYPAPAYYYGPPRGYYAPPVVSIGFGAGYGHGWRHGYRYWH